MEDAEFRNMKQKIFDEVKDAVNEEIEALQERIQILLWDLGKKINKEREEERAMHDEERAYGCFKADMGFADDDLPY